MAGRRGSNLLLSANNDSVIDGLIGSLLHKVGAQGVMGSKVQLDSLTTKSLGVKIPSGCFFILQKCLLER